MCSGAVIVPEIGRLSRLVFGWPGNAVRREINWSRTASGPAACHPHLGRWAPPTRRGRSGGADTCRIQGATVRSGGLRTPAAGRARRAVPARRRRAVACSPPCPPDYSAAGQGVTAKW